MAKSIEELLTIKRSARAVPIRNVSAINWPSIVAALNAGETLTFRTDCKFALPKNPADLTERLREYGYTGPLKVKRPLVEVVVLDPCVAADAKSAGGDPNEPRVERTGRMVSFTAEDLPISKQQLQKVYEVVKRGRGRPRKNP